MVLTMASKKVAVVEDSVHIRKAGRLKDQIPGAHGMVVVAVVAVERD